MDKAATVGIDLMGGERCPSVLIEAVSVLANSLDDKATLVVFGTADILKMVGDLPVEKVEVDEVISMDDNPLSAVRQKKRASMPLAMTKIREGELDAFVSTGNTGALTACSTLYLKCLGSISRPALLTLLPTKKNPIAVLDVGANVACTSKHLEQFAHMGIAYQKTRGIEKPTVGLLNIGTEPEKGRLELREAYQKLQSLGDQFVGNIEGREVFDGAVDVLVTDGFSGNVFLKTAEGISELILNRLISSLSPNCPGTLRDILMPLKDELDYTEYPGAIVCGVRGVVIKCHGSSNPKALVNGVKKALSLVREDFLKKIEMHYT